VCVCVYVCVCVCVCVKLFYAFPVKKLENLNYNWVVLIFLPIL